MNKQNLLKMIAETAYNVGYAAKLHFATFDIIEKAPGFLGFVSLVVGLYSLVFTELTAAHVSAAMVIVGIVSLYLVPYQTDKQCYDEAGKALTTQFDELKTLYFTVKSRSDAADVSDLIATHESIRTTARNVSHSKQVLFSDWYAHYKFFWQQQIDWVDEQKQFKLIRDKVPLTAWLAIVALAIVGLYFAAPKMKVLACLIS